MSLLRDLETKHALTEADGQLLARYGSALQLQLGPVITEFRQAALAHPQLLPVVEPNIDPELKYYDFHYLQALLSPQLDQRYVQQAERVWRTFQLLGAVPHSVSSVQDCLRQPLMDAAQRAAHEQPEQLALLQRVIDRRLALDSEFVLDLWVTGLANDSRMERRQTQRIAAELENVLRTRDFSAPVPSRYDRITGLLGRSGLIEKMRADLEIAERSKNVYALLCISGRYCSTDTPPVVLGLGREDKAMQQLATLIQQSLRQWDVLALVSDDTFGVSLPGCSGIQVANVVDRLQAAVQRDMPDVKLYFGSAEVGKSVSCAPEVLLNQAVQQVQLAVNENDSNDQAGQA